MSTTIMATPVKCSTVAVVPDITQCMACSERKQQKYFAVNRKGAKGPSLEAVEEFYDLKFTCTENVGAFVCKQCLRCIQRYRINLIYFCFSDCVSW